jgi:DNA-binding transcriptional LysR family regulator
MRPALDIEALRTIIVGNDLGSFSRAAIQLCRSQSAVSMHLKKLEEQVGQPLFRRSGRGLVPTDAGEALLAYARRIVAIHDEAAVALGAITATPTIRLGLAQDFFEDIMPDALSLFSSLQPNVHIEVRAGRNFALEEEVNTGSLDVALAFTETGRAKSGELLASMPMFWYGRDDTSTDESTHPGGLPLVLFHHPCLFRQNALHSLDAAGRRWRLSLTTSSLSGVWGALRFGLGITVRTGHGIPKGIRRLDHRHLPRLPEIELRLLSRGDMSPATTNFIEVLRLTASRRIKKGPLNTNIRRRTSA